MAKSKMSDSIRRLGMASWLLVVLGAAVAGTPWMAPAPLPSLPGSSSAPPEWRLELVYRIGAVEGPDYSLTRVGHIAVGAGGLLYVAQPREGVIRIFSGDGVARGKLGGAGSGPGEFVRLGRLGTLADGRLWAADEGLNRATLFRQVASQEYEHRTFSLVGSTSGLYLPKLVGVVDDGRAVVELLTESHRVADGEIATLPVLITDFSLTDADTMVRLPVERKVLAVRRKGERYRGLFGVQPLKSPPLWAVSPEGGRVVVVNAGAVSTGEAATFELRLVDTRANTIWEDHVSYEPVPMPSGLRDSLVDRWTEIALRSRGVAARNRAEAKSLVVDALYRPEFLPPVTDLVVGTDESIWLRREETGLSTVTWEAFNGEGTRLASLVAPSDLRILATDGQTVWGEEVGALDVPYVAAYRILRDP